MSADQVRQTMDGYMEALIARGDYGRFFADDIAFSIVGTDQQLTGAQGAEQAIRFIHQVAFDARPELVNLVLGERGAAAEAVFAGTHIGEFAGIPATGNAVRVPYSVFYELDGAAITALRIYLPMDQLIEQMRRPAATSSAGA
jgi:predicted ester cyclase